METAEAAVWVLSWRYSDGSASGVLRAYVTEERAQHDMDLLSADTSTSKDYELEYIPIYR